MKNRFQKTFILPALFGFLIPSVVVTWNPNNENDLAGYKVYWGIQSRRYDNFVNSGLDTCYTLNDLLPGNNYYFAVAAYDSSGNESQFSDEVSIYIEGDNNLLTKNKNLASYNFPNPFNPLEEVTHLRYYLDQEEIVSIDIYKPNESLIRNLFTDVNKSSGEHFEDIWDGKSNDGYYVPNGIYYAFIRIGDENKVITIGVVR